MAEITPIIRLETAEDYDQMTFELTTMLRAMQHVLSAEARRDDHPQMQVLQTLLHTAQIYADSLHGECFFALCKAYEQGRSDV